MIQSALLAVFLVSSSAAWGQECHTQCVYVPLEEGCQLMLEGSGEPWPVDRTLRVAASCLGDCWHPSQGKQPGAQRPTDHLGGGRGSGSTFATGG